MDTSKLTTQIQQFLDMLDTEPLTREHMAEHSSRHEKTAALPQADRLQ